MQLPAVLFAICMVVSDVCLCVCVCVCAERKRDGGVEERDRGSRRGRRDEEEEEEGCERGGGA